VFGDGGKEMEIGNQGKTKICMKLLEIEVEAGERSIAVKHRSEASERSHAEF